MTNDPIVLAVIDKFSQRSEVGVAKYGTTLAENDTDDFLVHLQQELMDAINYIEKLIQQRAAGTPIKGALNIDKYKQIDDEDFKWQTDLNNFGFTKSDNKVWAFYEDWFKSDINPEYSYYLTASIHIPIQAYQKDSLESKFCNIYVHRSTDIATLYYKDKRSDDYKLVYSGLIESSEDLKFILTKLGIIPKHDESK